MMVFSAAELVERLQTSRFRGPAVSELRLSFESQSHVASDLDLWCAAPDPVGFSAQLLSR